MKWSKVLQAADTVLVAECDASNVRLYNLSLSCFNRSKCWHNHGHGRKHTHTHTPINWGDKWRGVKIHHCLNTTSTETSSSPPSSFTSTLNLWHSHFSVTLLLLLVLLLVHRRGMCQFDHIIPCIFPSTATLAPSKCLFSVFWLLWLFLRFSLCVYFCSVCANKWGCVSERSLFPLFSASTGNLYTKPSASENQKKKK